MTPWTGRVRRFVFWLRDLDLFVLLAALAAVLGVLIFLTIADKVTEGQTQRFDEWVLVSLRNPHDRARPLGPDWLHEAGRDLTALGGFTVLSLTIAAVVGYLLMAGRYRAAVLVIAATLGALLLSLLLKDFFNRPRPTVVPHLSYVATTSFPSAHSMLSAAIYLTLGSLLARLEPRVGLKLYF